MSSKRLLSFYGNELKKIAFYSLFVLIGIGVYFFNFTTFTIRGQSMSPTFESGQKVVCNKDIKNLKRGDVITFKGAEEDEIWIKRIIAKPGDSIYCKNNIVYVNGKKIKESYLSDETVTEDFKKVKLKRHEYFLMGDNREKSSDSRIWGPFKDSFFISKVMFVYSV